MDGLIQTRSSFKMRKLFAVLPIVASLAIADHGPTMPPNPWDGLTLQSPAGTPDHGPTMPPNPWDGLY